MAKKQKKVVNLKQDMQKYLSRVSEEHIFWCHDGRILKDMKDLAEALATMSDETFAYHSNTEKKDFSNWVRDVIGDVKLADDLGSALSRTQAATIVASRITTLAK